MSQSDNDRVQDLCSKIAVEQDRQKFLKLVQELNRVLSEKDRRMKDKEQDQNKD